MEKQKVIVVGAGPAGITAANELEQLNYDVTVLEKNDHVGGMTKTIT